MRKLSTGVMVAMGVVLVGTSVPTQAADMPVDTNGNPVYTEASINFDEGVSGQSSVEFTKNYKQGLDNDAFGRVSVDVNRPGGIIRMRASMDNNAKPGDSGFDTVSQGIAEAIYRDQITLSTTDFNNDDPPEHLNLTLGMDAEVRGSPAANDTSRVGAGTSISAATVGDSGEFRRIDGSNPGANMESLTKNKFGGPGSAFVTFNPGATSDVLTGDNRPSVGVPWDSYTGPTTTPETFDAFYQAELTIEIPLEKVENGVAYYPFQIEASVSAGASAGGFAETDMGQSITLNALTLPDGSPLAGNNFESGATLVPEPSTAAVFATLLGGLGLGRRRRRG